MNAERLRKGRRRGLAAFHADEQGTSAIEMVLSLPILVLVMLVLIGMGHTLMAKPHALVAARYAAQHATVHGSPPSAAAVSRAVGGRGEDWGVSVTGTGADDESVGELERESNQAGDRGVVDVFGSMLNVLSGKSRVVARTGARPRRGILPRVMRLGEAEGAFVVEHDPWTCEKNRGSYLTILTSRASSAGGSIPGIGKLLNVFDDKAGELPCCVTYKSDGERR